MGSPPGIFCVLGNTPRPYSLAMALADTLPAPLSAPSRRFFAIWDGWRRGRKLPESRDIDLGAFGEMAEGCFLVQVRSRDEIPILYAGPLIARHIGFDLTGYNYLDLTMRENRAFRAALTIEQLLQPCGFMLYYWLRHPSGAMMPIEWVGAPICETGVEKPAMIFSCAVPLSRSKVAGPADPDSYQIADGMRFIDLGYGIPALNPSAPQRLLKLE